MADKYEPSGCRDAIPAGIALAIFLVLGQVSKFDKSLAEEILIAIFIAIGLFLAFKFITAIMGKDLKDTLQNIKKLAIFFVGFVMLVFVFGILSKCSGDSSSLPATEMYYRK